MSNGEILMTVPSLGRPWRIGVVDHCRRQCKGGHGTDLAFAGLPGVDIVAVADSDDASRNDLQQSTGAPRAYADWGDLLKHEELDVVCVCSRWPTEHPALVMAATEAGCHVFCEKPFAATLTEADRMIAAADKHDVRLAVAHLGRYWPALAQARTMIHRGDIGRPLSVFCRGKEDNRGGGEDALVLGSHLLDLACHFFGSPSWAFADITLDGRPIVEADAQQPTEPVGAVAGDEVVALFGFPGGVRCHFESRRDLYKTGDPRMAITIVGTEATLFFRYDNARNLRIRRGNRPLEEGGDYETVELPRPPMVNRAVPLKSSASPDYFPLCNRLAAVDLLQSVVDQRDPISSGRSARWSLEMIHGTYRSHLSKTAVALPLIRRNHPLQLPSMSTNLQD